MGGGPEPRYDGLPLAPAEPGPDQGTSDRALELSPRLDPVLGRRALVLQPKLGAAAPVRLVHQGDAGRTGAHAARSEPALSRWLDRSLALQSPAPDGKHYAYGQSEGGSDWATIYLRTFGSGRNTQDTIRWVKFSGLSWTKDGRGFFYSRFPAPPKGKEIQTALPQSDHLLPRGRHSPVGGHEDLRSAGPADVVRQRRPRRNAPLPLRAHHQGHRQERPVHRRPRRPTQAQRARGHQSGGHRAGRQLCTAWRRERPTVSADRQERPQPEDRLDTSGDTGTRSLA